jgi:hypothetical protein
MGYIEGTLNSGTGNAPALYNAIAAEMLSVGYTLESELNISSNDIKVWKSPATADQEWYIAFAYANSNQIYVYTMEGWNPVTSSVIRGAYFLTTAFSPESEFASRHGNTEYYITNSNLGNTRLLQSACPIFEVATVAFSYRILVTPNHITGSTSVNWNTLIYAGTFIPSDALNYWYGEANMEYFPIVCGNTKNSNNASMTRFVPGHTDNYAWASAYVAMGGNTDTYGTYTGFGPAFLTPFAFRPNSISYKFHGGWGYYSDLFLLSTASPVSIGDKLISGSDEYIVMNINTVMKVN